MIGRTNKMDRLGISSWRFLPDRWLVGAGAHNSGYLPGTLWILIGVVLGGAVQDFVILFASIRRSGKSLGQ